MKAIIVEDEFPAREELKYFIKSYSDIEVLSEIDNGIEVLKFIQENHVDVIFLDINIPLLDGLLLAQTLNNFKIKPKIVFITAYKEYAIEAFELEAFDYILKPYSEERIISMLKKLENSKEQDTTAKSKNSSVKYKVSAWKEDKMVVIDLEDIYYCEADERDTIIYTQDDKYIVKYSISELERNISSDSFFKTHRSYIVNISKIKEIIPWFNSTYMLKLSDSEYKVPVSRGKLKEFRQIMNI